MDERVQKTAVLNYAASFLLFPTFEHQNNLANPLISRNRVRILLNQHKIEAIGLGAYPPDAEFRACADFVRRTSHYLRTLGAAPPSTKGPFSLTLQNAKPIVEWIGRVSKPPFSLSVCLEQNGRKLQQAGMVWSAHVVSSGPGDAKLYKGEIVQDSRKEGATKMAWLAIAVQIVSKNPKYLADFANGSQAGQLVPKVSGKAISMVLDDTMVEIVRGTIRKIGKANGFAQKASRRVRSEDFEDASLGKIFRDVMPASIVNMRSIRLKEKLDGADGLMDKLAMTRAELPMVQHRDQVLKLVNENQFGIIIGETGSGKTTQVPQIIFEDFIRRGEGGKCNIICTQPRRIAATSVARRVSFERRETLTESIGYQVRFDTQRCDVPGSVTYCTTGILLRQMQSAADAVFDVLSHIVVDEVHERDVDIDFLLVLLKLTSERRAKAKKHNPRIILMSATMDTERFATYFQTTSLDGVIKPCPAITVPGRAFPVLARYLNAVVEKEFAQYTTHELNFLVDDEKEKNSTKKYLEAELGFAASREMPLIQFDSGNDGWKATNASQTVTSMPETPADSIVPHRLIAFTIAHVCNTSSAGSVLVFLPGMHAIDQVEDLIRNERPLGLQFNSIASFRIIKLHSQLRDQQDDAFKPVPEGCRKILLSTNIAETSITIPEIRFVIDTGKHSISKYDSQTRISSLNCTWVSQSNATQRKGRAGRVQKGNYYALFSELRYLAFEATVQPEMTRVDLQEICLKTKACSGDLSVKEFLAAAVEPPMLAAIETALRQLVALGALTPDEKLTPLGRALLQVPLHPPLGPGKMTVLSIIFRCFDPVLIIGAQTDGEALFNRPLEQRAEADRAVRRFADSTNSDVISVMHGYRNARLTRINQGPGAFGRFLYDNFLKKSTFFTVEKQIDAIEHALQACHAIPLIPFTQRRDGRVGNADLNGNADRTELFNALLVAGFTNDNIAVVREKSVLKTSQHKTVFMHPSSLNDKKKGGLRRGSLWCFGGLSKKDVEGRLTLRDTSPISPFMTILFSNSLEVANDGLLQVDGWLSFYTTLTDGTSFDANLIVRFRTIIDQVLNDALENLFVPRSLSDQTLADNPQRDVVVDAIVELLEHDAALNQIYD